MAHGSIDEKVSHTNSFPLHISKYYCNSWKSFVEPTMVMLAGGKN
jgi:hypothetical protein